MVLSSWQGHCESSLGSFDECRLSAKWLPTLRPSHPTWAVSPPVGCFIPSTPYVAKGRRSWGGCGGPGPSNISLRGPFINRAPIRDPISKGSRGIGKRKENKRRDEEKWSMGPSNLHHRSTPFIIITQPEGWSANLVTGAKQADIQTNRL